jgi:3',5'-cyclic AMP phosphodiesterase CpdA
MASGIFGRQGRSSRRGIVPRQEQNIMTSNIDRRELIALAGIGGLGVVFGSALAAPAQAQNYPAASAGGPPEDFFFIQLSDTHWGFKDDSINPDASGTFKKVITAINALSRQPDFIAFTGDMTHTTDDPRERRKRMAEMRDMIGQLKVKDVRFVPGDHDAQKDRGEAYQEFFGKLNYTFDRQGYHFVVLDNTSDPDQKLGDAQIAWLAADLKQLAPATPVVVLTHRPLFDLYKAWGWWTPDGEKALDLLKPFKTTVFYGHIHHEHHTTANGVVHHATTSLMIPLFPAGTRAERTTVPWNPARPYAGMGWRAVSARGRGTAWEVNQEGVVAG